MAKTLKDVRAGEDNAGEDKVKRGDAQILAPKSDHARIVRERSEQTTREVVRQNGEHEHDRAREADRDLNRLPHPISVASAEVLPDDRTDRKTQSHDGKKERLHYPRTDSEASLGRWPEVADHSVNDEDEDGEDREPRACGQTDAQHGPPRSELRTPKTSDGTADSHNSGRSK